MSNTFWNEKITIGNLVLPRFMAAPLDGITDSPLRQLIREFCQEELVMSEMRHICHVAHDRREQTLKYHEMEHPIAFQFSANRFQFMDLAVEKVIAAKFDMINLNAGCPSPTVTRSGSGSALMANPKLLQELLEHFCKLINGRVPMTLKIRAGYKEVNALEIARIAEGSGMDCIMIHPRTAPGMFTSPLDFELVRKVKESVKIPVIFSGNVNSFRRAKMTHELTGVDGFMIGRALWGAPWKMREIIENANGNEFSVDTATALKYALKHFKLNLQHYGINGFNVFKKQLPQYIKSINNAGEWRTTMLRSQSADELQENLEKVCTEYF